MKLQQQTIAAKFIEISTCCLASYFWTVWDFMAKNCYFADLVTMSDKSVVHPGKKFLPKTVSPFCISQ